MLWYRCLKRDNRTLDSPKIIPTPRCIASRNPTRRTTTIYSLPRPHSTYPTFRKFASYSFITFQARDTIFFMGRAHECGARLPGWNFIVVWLQYKPHVWMNHVLPYSLPLLLYCLRLQFSLCHHFLEVGSFCSDVTYFLLGIRFKQVYGLILSCATWITLLLVLQTHDRRGLVAGTVCWARRSGRLQVLHVSAWQERL